jgi:hypothetical protein
MKKQMIQVAVFLFLMLAAACGGSSDNSGTDTTAPAAADTMPVLEGHSNDSTGVMETPPTNDDNVIMPDSAIKSQ